MQSIIFPTKTTVSVEIAQCKWLISFSKSQYMRWWNSESHGKTKGWWPPPTVSCPLKPASSPPKLAGDHTTDLGLWSGWLIDHGICGWKKNSHKNNIHPGLDGTFYPNHPILDFLIYSFIPQVFRHCLKPWWLGGEHSRAVPALRSWQSCGLYISGHCMVGLGSVIRSCLGLSSCSTTCCPEDLTGDL